MTHMICFYAKNSFLSRWGGEIVRDRFYVSMSKMKE
jgi:phage-related protein